MLENINYLHVKKKKDIDCYIKVGTKTDSLSHVVILEIYQKFFFGIHEFDQKVNKGNIVETILTRFDQKYAKM